MTDIFKFLVLVLPSATVAFLGVYCSGRLADRMFRSEHIVVDPTQPIVIKLEQDKVKTKQLA